MPSNPDTWKTQIEKAISSIRSVLSQNIVDIPVMDRSGLEQNLKKIEEKLSEDRLKIAMIGEFSAGKSTFINALLGKKILKSGLRPTTAAITEIGHGSDEIFVEKKDICGHLKKN